MDVFCLACGEPWELAYVLQAEPNDFERRGPAIVKCPCCTDARIAMMSDSLAEEFLALKQIAEAEDEDLDGFASFLENVDFRKRTEKPRT